MSATFTICEGAVKRKGRTKTLVCTSFFYGIIFMGSTLDP